MNDGHVVEDSTMNEIEKHSAEVTENVQNEAAESEQMAKRKLLKTQTQRNRLKRFQL